MKRSGDLLDFNSYPEDNNVINYDYGSYQGNIGVNVDSGVERTYPLSKTYYATSDSTDEAYNSQKMIRSLQRQNYELQVALAKEKNRKLYENDRSDLSDNDLKSSNNNLIEEKKEGTESTSRFNHENNSHSQKNIKNDLMKHIMEVSV